MGLYDSIKDKFSCVSGTKKLSIEGIEDIEVKQYLPIVEKGKLINDVIKAAIDYTTNTFSPLRLEVYFYLYTLKYYADINAPMTSEEVGEAYDLLETNDIINKVISLIPKQEFEFLEHLMDTTAEDITKYSYSLAGMLGSMSKDASQLESSMKDIFESIRSEDGKKVLDIVKNMGGND